MVENTVSINLVGYEENTCVYCGPVIGNYSVGMIPLKMSCSYYQAMIDRNWVRSGNFCYKPDMRRTCCPQYTIRLDVDAFSPTRSQRKAVHRWNRYVILGAENGEAMEEDGDSKASTRKKAPSKSIPFSLVHSIHASEASFVKRQNTSHRFEVTLEPSSMSDEKFELFAKYQADVHGDAGILKWRFKAFLVESPLEYSPISYSKEPPAHLPLNYGSYHQLYRLDGKLIAMSVLDVLPTCVCSTYFVYDTTWEKFSLGTVSVMREAALVKEIHDHGVPDMKYLYMGYYVPSSKKMTYKGDFSPSYLLDPEQYSWHPLNSFVSMFDKYRYVSFANPERSLERSDIPALEPPPEISDEEASQIWTFNGGVGDWQPLKESIYWGDQSQMAELLRTIEYLGKDLSRKSSFRF